MKLKHEKADWGLPTPRLPPPTTEELYRALDDLHVTCECSVVVEVDEWYRSDPFALEARQNAIEILRRYLYYQKSK